MRTRIIYTRLSALFTLLCVIQINLAAETTVIVNVEKAAHLTAHVIDSYPAAVEDACFAGDAETEPSLTAFLLSLKNLEDHINDTHKLTNEKLLQVRDSILKHQEILAHEITATEATFDVIQTYNEEFGALFTKGSATEGGYERADESKILDHIIVALHQIVLDHTYKEENLIVNYDKLQNLKFATSAYFPGAVDPPADPTVTYSVQVNGTNMPVSGTPANYVDKDNRRPTGCYLAPGSIAEITVPSSLVGIDASILVGAQTWDLSKKKTVKRVDRVTKKYSIDSTTVTIGSPFGGGIYVNIPFESDLGIIDIKIVNAVRSPYYANTVANQTSLTEWQDEERLHKAPWADFESDKVMMNVPTSWIYALEDPSSMMTDWDLACDAISEMQSRPFIRSKTLAYSIVDVIRRGSANFPGYPFSNVTYDPYADYDGNHDNYLINGPREERGSLISTFFHELGHAEKIYKFRGEQEAFVNFLWVAVYNKKFGVDIQTAMSESFWAIDLDLDEAAISWMVAENFREGKAMSYQGGEYRHEFSYQQRGYAKYADVVLMFGWEGVEKLYAIINEQYENGTYGYDGNVNLVPADPRILRMSQATGYDMRPLVHFWGIPPDEPVSLEASIASIGAEKSAAIYDRLNYYKSIIPASKEAFQALGLSKYTLDKIEEYKNPFDHKVRSYFQGFFSDWWDEYNEEEADAARKQIDYLIDLYFPDGRP